MAGLVAPGLDPGAIDVLLPLPCTRGRGKPWMPTTIPGSSPGDGHDGDSVLMDRRVKCRDDGS
jgi:hypothetical protein